MDLTVLRGFLVSLKRHHCDIARGVVLQGVHAHLSAKNVGGAALFALCHRVFFGDALGLARAGVHAIVDLEGVIAILDADTATVEVGDHDVIDRDTFAFVEMVRLDVVTLGAGRDCGDESTAVRLVPNDIGDFGVRIATGVLYRWDRIDKLGLAENRGVVRVPADPTPEYSRLQPNNVVLEP